MSGRYVRIYYSVRTDEKFRDVYPDDALFAAWVRLLMMADEAYPEPAHLPVGIRKSVVKKLVDAQIITVFGQSLFRVVGLDAERRRRSEPKRAAAEARWSVKPDADALQVQCTDDASALLARAEQEHKQEHKQEQEQGAPASMDDDPLDAWYRLTASWPSSRISPWLERLANDHGPADLIAALAVEWKADPDRATVLGRVETRLKREAHERRRAGDAAAKARAEQERRAIEEMPIEQRAANMARLREEMARAGLLPKEEAA